MIYRCLNCERPVSMRTDYCSNCKEFIEQGSTAVNSVIVDQCYNYISVWHEMTIDYLFRSCRINYGCSKLEFQMAVCRYIDNK